MEKQPTKRVTSGLTKTTISHVARALGVKYFRAYYLLNNLDEAAWHLAEDIERAELERRERIARIVSDAHAIAGTQI